MIWLHLATEPPRAFYIAGDTEPNTTALALPALVGVGTLRRPLGGENANLTVELDNARGQLTATFADPPLLAGAALYRDGVVLLSGSVGDVSMDSTVRMTLEA